MDNHQIAKEVIEALGGREKCQKCGSLCDAAAGYGS